MKAPALLLGLFVFAAAVLHAASSPRTWTSKDGAATLTATFNRLEGDKVTLILPNGRSQVIAKAFFSDADIAWIDQNSSAPLPSSPSATSAETTGKIAGELSGQLIDAKGADAALENPTAKHFLFYYSASWCGPCQMFTPNLIRFYRTMKKDLEVVMVPYDKTAEDELAYMKEHKMPWRAVKFDLRNKSAAPNFPGGGIPGMVLTDAEGKPLLDTNKIQDREDFLKQTKTLLRTSSSS